jgi:hypothetical protein
MYGLDHDHTKEDQELLEEPVQVEEVVNTELTEGKLWCIPPYSLILISITTLC